MRYTYACDPDDVPCCNDVIKAVSGFYKTHKQKPTSIKMRYDDLQDFLAQTRDGNGVVQLETGKTYATHIITPCGVALLEILDDQQERKPGESRNAIIVVESDLVDKEFEKQVLSE